MQRAAVLLLVALLGFGAVAVHAKAVCQSAVVQQGDTIIILAERYGTTPDELEAALTACINGYKPGTYLQPNQQICLPPFVDACRYVRSSTNNNECKFYTVQPTDTMDSIGTAFGIPRMDIEAVNPGIDPSALPVNSFVKLPDWAATCPEPAAAEACRYYVAQQGDSLAAIATSFSLKLEALQAVNSNMDGNLILQPGQKIFLPPFDQNTCGAGKEVKKPSNCRAYIVIQGDSLASVAFTFQTTVDQILAINTGLAGITTLTPGTQILLPPSDPATCVNPDIVSPTPSPPSPPSPPPSPSPPPMPPSPPPAPVETPDAPTGEPAPELPPVVEPPAPAEPPVLPPEVQPEPPVVEAPPPQEAAPPTDAAAAASRIAVALLALIGAAVALL